jgi:hypothetical protein
MQSIDNMKNNSICDNVKIMENVINGNNNKIYDNTVIIQIR